MIPDIINPKTPNKAISIQKTITNKSKNNQFKFSNLSVPETKPMPILTTLMIEQDILFSKTQAEVYKFNNVVKNSKEVQCTILTEPVVHRRNRSNTVKSQHKFMDSEMFDKETLETLKKLCELAGLSNSKNEHELENLPFHLKLEL